LRGSGFRLSEEEIMALRKIHIIDDDPDFRMRLEFFLSRIGYDVMTSKSAEEGLKSCFENPPHVVLMEVALPGMNGYDACSRIKGEPTTQRTSVLLVTSRPAAEIMNKGPMACADFFISKPVDPNNIGADLFILFENGFKLNEKALSTLRVAKRIPEFSETTTTGYGRHDPSIPRIQAPVRSIAREKPAVAGPSASPRAAMKPAMSESDRRAGTVAERPASPSSAAPKDRFDSDDAGFDSEFDKIPAAEGKPAPRSASASDLQQVHDLLRALKKSLKDTSQRLDAVLQYIDVIDEG
jgi:CheY-like chemotaxis protein